MILKFSMYFKYRYHLKVLFTFNASSSDGVLISDVLDFAMVIDEVFFETKGNEKA